MQTKVFITVDIEVWPGSSDWRAANLGPDVKRYVYGATSRGEFGLRYQLDLLNSFGLKGVFFVESLFASEAPARLGEIVGLIRDRGHDVQLHVHPEWLQWMANPPVREKMSRYLKDFTEDEQALLVERALANLRACGAESVCAFRAGNYGANLDTLKALKRNGIAYDSSYNFPYLSSQCFIDLPSPLLQPRALEGIVEFPITFFWDRPRHHRHLQLTACSFAEIRNVLLEARRQGWFSVVLVSHSFELLRNRTHHAKPLLPDTICVNRFKQVCRFLADHADQFSTATFADFGLDGAAVPVLASEENRILKSNMLRTAGRFGEQFVRRLQ